MFSSSLPTHIIFITGVIAALFIIFLWKYLIPGWAFWFKLRKTIKKIRLIKEQGAKDPGEAFKNDRVMAHLWAEYTETLHEQKFANSLTAIEEVTVVRATLPAEAFFSPQTLVDSRLHVEFFKHLPGLFTGVGIIGTFLGLINGLKSFQISENPSIVRNSLDMLLHGVHEAFFVSASAIALAMLVTFLEKWLLSGLHRQVQELCYMIDSFFEAGAGEEYLARLVKASEDSASQAKILKDAMVGELKQILSELIQQQISATHASQQHMAERLVESIETGIRQPIGQLVEGFAVQQQHTSENLSTALSDVLAAFIQKTEDMFGGQIAGINTLQQKTIESLETAVNQLGQMAESIDTSGRNATESMTGKLTDAINAMEVRQRVMNDQMADFVTQLHGMVTESQTETSQKLQALLGDLGQQVATMVAALQSQANQNAELHANQQQQLSSHMAGAMQSVSTEMRDTIQTLSAQVSSMVGALEQRCVSTSQQLAEQQTRFATSTENSVAQLAQSVDQVVTKVSDETSVSLARLADLIEKQQTASAEATRSMQSTVASSMSSTLQAVTAEMGNTMHTLSAQVSSMVGALEQRSVSTSQQLAEQQSRFATSTESNVAHLTQSVETSVARVTSETSAALSRLVGLIESQQANGAEATRSMQAAVLGMREITQSAVGKMNQGADTLFLAADEFGKAGKGVSGVLVEASGLARELTSSASSVSNAARSIEGIVADYRAAQDSLSTMISALNDTVDAARKEASMTQDVLAHIERSAEKLAAAQHEADHYLDEVSRVLTETHQEFASNMRTTLGEANKQFYASLTEATSLLREGIQELDATLSGIGNPVKR